MIDIKGLFQRDDRDNNRYVILNNCNGNIKIPHIEVLEMIIPKRRIYSSVFCWLSLMIGAKKEHCLIKSKNFSVMFSQDNKNIANIGVKAEEVAFFNNIIIKIFLQKKKHKKNYNFFFFIQYNLGDIH